MGGEISDWYSRLYSRSVDLVGDYAGAELFLVEGDSLLHEAFSDPQLDFKGAGFQLLHAVYNVELLIKRLHVRNCKFNIAFIDEHKYLCVPTASMKNDRAKYLLARAAIIRHLQQNTAELGVDIDQFPSITAPEFKNYLHEAGYYFVMCSDGSIVGKGPHEEFIWMINWLLALGWNIALVNGLEFQDTKVMAMVLEGSSQQKIHTKPSLHGLEDELAELSTHDHGADLNSLKASSEPNHPFSEREIITILSLQRLCIDQAAVPEECAAFLLHTAALSSLPLQHRLARRLSQSDESEFLAGFTEIACQFMNDRLLLSQLEDCDCDIADLIDGRLFASVLSGEHVVNRRILERQDVLAGALADLLQERGIANVDILSLPPAHNSSSASDETTRKPNTASRIAQVLPFVHPVFDQHLAPIHLEIDERTAVDRPGTVRLFAEISHWHNSKKLINKGHHVQKLGFYALRRNQNFMKEMIAYAASLTNAVGKVLEPETIVVKQAGSGKPERTKQVHAPPKPKTKTNVNTGKSSNKVGGKAAALAAAAQVQATKDKQGEAKALNAWSMELKEMARLSGQDRYLRAEKLLYHPLLRGSRIVLAEIQLYRIVCLYEMLESSSIGGSTKYREGLLALIFSIIQGVSQEQLELTEIIASTLTSILVATGLPKVPLTNSGDASKCSFPISRSLIAKSAKDSPIITDTYRFQLEHCGPYFDRSFDPAPDSRVPFQPDGWQRKVLDAIDEDKSLLVLAPTSAGKTFISFYAMKQVLETSDDGVLVYVAPTKALVNQIAAEVQARFSKDLKYEGRSVWGIHTRDFRVNNATGCQVLVTVPHILQIMLLAPTNADKKSSWSNRIRRIIFDEVHCIGQADDGLIWEQILLLAPCPIIGLSATVGNPEAIGDWLKSTQVAIGNEFVVIHHGVRYSDLRKFYYEAPKTFAFKPLESSSTIHIPGLDDSDRFKFIHPVTSLIDRARGIPSDLAFEARDCLTLYQAMQKHQTKSHPFGKDLEPAKKLPKIMKKVDILRWESELKDVLRKWMADIDSPFEAVRKELSFQAHDQEQLPETKENSRNDATVIDSSDHSQTTLPLLMDLHEQNALPAIIFNFDRVTCEEIARAVMVQLQDAESAWKESSTSWKKKMQQWEEFKQRQEVADRKAKKSSAAGGDKAKKVSKKKKGGDGDDGGDDGPSGKLESLRDSASSSTDPLASFDPTAPQDGFHFADWKKMLPSEFENMCKELKYRGVSPWLLDALRRGIGVHHAGMNRKYRQVTEMWFRLGFLRVVVATGTLALGINMPCKTVVFSGDSVFLTALNFRQCAGRAGRRGFDILGNVVFQGIGLSKAHRLMSSRLPDLNGHFPITTTLVLRLFTLLHESKQSQYASNAVNALLSQPRLYLGGAEAKMTVLHHLRFSIEYLRRQALLGPRGEPFNFAGLVSHLYYTENAGFAFHALLKGGYFHRLCAGIKKNSESILLELMLTMSHVFQRHPMKELSKRYIEEVVTPSSSIVILPKLPTAAKELLAEHHDETLAIYHAYVSTFIQQHIHEPDDELPFTKIKFGGSEQQVETASASDPPVLLRSPFVALSGHDDKFSSIHDLCSTVRSGVFLEESVIPHVNIENNQLLNAYLYDFFKHGSVEDLVRANRIRRGEVWYRLNDFSMVLATIIASMKNFMGISAEQDNFEDIRGGGDQADEIAGDKSDGEDGEKSLPDDEPAWSKGSDGDMMRVLEAFVMLKMQFDEKFKVMWA